MSVVRNFRSHKREALSASVSAQRVNNVRGSFIRLTMAEMRFVVKNLAAEELVLVTGPDMMTLGDIRRATRVRWHLPIHLQRLICSGREYVHHPDW